MRDVDVWGGTYHGDGLVVDLFGRSEAVERNVNTRVRCSQGRTTSRVTDAKATNAVEEEERGGTGGDGRNGMNKLGGRMGNGMERASRGESRQGAWRSDTVAAGVARQAGDKRAS